MRPTEPLSKEASAASAAPEHVGRAATIIDSDAAPNGSMSVLRGGSNGWSCFPDFPGAPFDGPACLDGAWMAFFEAYTTGATPQHDTIDVSYMLQGGGDAGTTDPTLMAPPNTRGPPTVRIRNWPTPPGPTLSPAPAVLAAP